MWNAEQFKARREAAGLTLEAVAAELLVNPTTVWRWEAGKSVPHLLFQRALEDALARLSNGKPEDVSL